MKTVDEKRLYRVWASMIQRCENVNNNSYTRYGGRGISVCKAWHNFKRFYADMGIPLEGYQIDREDNNRGYNKTNCRWVTKQDNLLNKGMYKSNLTGIKGVCQRGDRHGLFRVRVRRYKKIVLDRTVNCFFEACCIYKSFVARELAI